MSETELNAIDLKVQDLLVDMWNDLSNRQAGEILFEHHQDILSVHSQIMDIIKGVAPPLKEERTEE
jgi:hypothetical protein